VGTDRGGVERVAVERDESTPGTTKAAAQIRGVWRPRTGSTAEDGGTHHRDPIPVARPFRDYSAVLAGYDMVGYAPLFAPFIPCLVRIERGAQDRGEHSGRQILSVVPRHSRALTESVMKPYFEESVGVARPILVKARRLGSFVASSLSTQKTIRPAANSSVPMLDSTMFAARGEDRGHSHEIVICDTGLTKGHLEAGQLLAMHTRAHCEEHPRRDELGARDHFGTLFDW
jgi:hypothetical protein